MKPVFPRNIDTKGRWLRGLGALALFAGAGFAFTCCAWLALALLASGLFVAFEAMRGWCALRACGIRTKI